MATGIANYFSLTSNPKEISGLNFLEAAELVTQPENGSTDEWKTWYEDVFGEAAKARWSKTQIVQALMANYIEEQG